MSVIGSNVLAGASGSGVAGFQITRSLRFDSSSSSYLNRTPSSAGNRKTWTWSGWVKRSKLGAWSVIFSVAGSGSNDYLAFDPSNRLTFDLANGGSGSKLTTRVFRDCSAFYHIVLAVNYTSATANDRIKLYVNGVLETTFDTNTAPVQDHSGNVNNNTAHRISSVPTGIDFFNGYLADVHFIDGQALAPTDFGEYDDNNVWQPIEYAGTYGPLVDQSQTWSTYGTYTGSTNNASGTGWQSAFDSSLTTYTWSSSGSDLTFTNAISYTSKVEIYGYKFDAADEIRVNGSAVSGFNIGNTDSSLGWVTALTGSGSLTSIGSTGFGLVASVRVDGKLLIDSGISIPNNSFKLDFSDNSSASALGTDSSGNSNTWTVNNFSVASGAGNDSLIDTPTNYEAASGNNGGNYCTLNPLAIGGGSLSNGNLEGTCPINATHHATFAIPASGKYYFEAEMTNSGILNLGLAEYRPGGHVYSISNSVLYSTSGVKNVDGVNDVAYGATWTIGDIIGVACDADAGTINFYKNNVAQGALTHQVGGLFPSFGNGGVSTNYRVNFGQRPFAYTPPTGYLSLCTQNLTDPTIADGSTAMDVALYTGNGSTQTISGLGFSPDLVWLKSRSETGRSHSLYDTVRGTTQVLKSDNTDAEVTMSGLTAFNSDGFALGSHVNSNNNNVTYVAWTWDAGTSNTSISIGGLNSSVYDQSQTWSNMTSTSGNYVQYSTNSADKLFDGSLSQGWQFSGTTASAIFTPTTPISYTSQVRVYIGATGNIANTQYKVNSGSYQSFASSGAQWLTILSGSGTFSRFELYQNGDPYTMAMNAIEVDGKILVDSGATPPNVPTNASTVRANASAGFSIVTYTGGSSTPANSDSGDSFGHGLNAAPQLVICKKRTGANSWPVYHASTALGALVLDGTNALDTSSYLFAQKHPSSSVVYLGNNPEINNSSHDYVAYCFAPVEGYSAFGSYTGNGSTDGPFVYTGFRPAFLIIKNASQANSWFIMDTKRNTFNVVDDYLLAESSAAEASSAWIDILSNGFKIRSTATGNNNNGIQNLYIAFAEHPFSLNGGLAR